MFNVLSQYSHGKVAWFLLLISTVIFESTALYFQHGLKLQPCSLCIYQRCALFGILFASIIGLFFSKYTIFRFGAIVLWIYSAVSGFLLAYQQARLQFEPTFADSCSLYPDFPTWLPLHEWFPAVFDATGSCAAKLWSFLTIEMSQWMIIIFACYIIVALLVLISQLFSPKRRSIWQ